MERMIYGRTLQQVTEEILSKSIYQPVQIVSTVNQQVTQPTSIIAPAGEKRSRKEKRLEAKRKWFLKKKDKTIS